MRRGETLYSIAFRHELDYRELAALNGIAAPYLIHPGQHLALLAARVPVTDQEIPPESLEPAVIVQRGDTLFSLARRFNVDPHELASLNGIRRPYTLYPNRRLRLPARDSHPSMAAIAASQPELATERSTGPTSLAALPAPNYSPITWIWPAQGPIVRPYSSAGVSKKGIGISGQLGDPVRAAAPGRVVYSGDGLIGYGQLIILQHPNGYLSAYGHNRKLLVSEGNQVAAGQSIAELGDTGTDQPLLHFEIRHGGKPENPLAYLPRF